MTFKLAVLSSHPIQYQAPLFRELANQPDIDLTVYFCRDSRTEKEQYDPGFGINIKWDIPLLEGYRHKFLTNRALSPSSSMFGMINPAIITELRKNNYDAILVHGYAAFSYWLAFLGAWISRTPILFRGESHLLKERPAWKLYCKRIVLSHLFKKIDALLPIGTLNAEYYRHYGVPGKKMFHAPYAVDNHFFSRNYAVLYDKKKEIKTSLGIAPDIPVILYVSKMTPRKRAMDLLMAFEKVHEKSDAALVLVGDGADRSALQSYAKKHGMKQVYFAGFKNQSELPEYYAAADIFVLPSTGEPWGLVINEAMNFGLPVITTDQVGAAPDLVRHGENGFVYPAGDIEKLADCLLQLLQGPGLRDSMGKGSKEIISKWSFKEDIEGVRASLQYVVRR